MNKIILIAEAGINHNGNINKAMKLIDVAANAKVDYVKFQFYKTRNLVIKKSKMANYQKKNLGESISQYELLKKYELSLNEIKKLKKYAEKKKIKFLCSVFDTESLDELLRINIVDFKIPSGEINNIPLLQKISKKAKRIFLSSGMANLKEISYALKILKKNKYNKRSLYLLHCHTEYPTNLKNVNLLAMPKLKKIFKVRVGYSDHTLENKVAISAIALGASVIEKHFTLSKNLKGPDHKASLEPKELKKFVHDIKDTEILLGNANKKISLIELSNKKLVRKSIVAKELIKKGQKFQEKNIICKRPEGGLSPLLWNKVIGKKAKKKFKINQKITL